MSTGVVFIDVSEDDESDWIKKIRSHKVRYIIRYYDCLFSFNKLNYGWGIYLDYIPFHIIIYGERSINNMMYRIYTEDIIPDIYDIINQIYNYYNREETIVIEEE